MAHKKTMSLVEDFNNIPEEALVPEAEQPYPIPAHWKWVRIGCITSASKKKTDVFSGDQHYLGLENLESGGGLSSISSVDGIKSSKSIFTAGQILYGRLRPYLDKHIVADFDGVCSTDILVYETSSILNAHYFDFWLSTSTFRNAAVSQSKGINLPRISESAISQFPFPLPPIDEQREIISYLEANLAKIDQVTEKFEIFLENSETRVKSILEAAVQGYLTEDWRSQRDGSKAEWTARTLGSLGAWGGGGTPKKSVTKYWANGSIRWVTPKDMKEWMIETTQDHVTETGVAESSATLYEGPAVCIVVRSGILRRILPSAAIDGEFTVNQDVKVLHSIDEKVNSEFVHFYLTAREAHIRSFASKSGTTVESIDFKKLKNLIIELPPPEEQDLIVCKVEMLLGSANRITELVSHSLEVISQVRSKLITAALAGLLTPGKM